MAQTLSFIPSTFSHHILSPAERTEVIRGWERPLPFFSQEEQDLIILNIKAFKACGNLYLLPTYLQEAAEEILTRP
jgi:hypothetical protein